ncbi:hypothetical protein [Pseudomonas panipatensis]|uniref:hypothetical protein n=1 Tax=Pseudomonas panipatensis TaxID=428992 RepID=UPI0035AFA567
MKCIIKGLAYASVLLSSLACAAMPIADLDAFESGYIGCLKKFDPKCFSKSFSGHFVPGDTKMEGLLQSFDKFSADWSNGKVFEVHPVDHIERGKIFDIRTYFVEREDGAIAGLRVRFRKFKGQWYVYGMTISSENEMLNEIRDKGAACAK